MIRSSNRYSFFPIILTLLAFVALSWMMGGFFVYLAKDHLPIEFIASTTNKSKIESIIKEVIKEQPELIIEAIQEFQNKAMKEAASLAKAAISEKRSEIEDTVHSPFISGQNADIIIVEFFDYFCSYCKKADQTIQKLIANDHKIKVIYKELPILGDKSRLAAEFAIAIHLIEPQQYIKAHEELMILETADEEKLETIAQKLNISYIQIKELMKSNQVKDELEKVQILAKQIGISGTPAFVVNGELLSGAVDYQSFTKIIDKARSH